MTISVVLVGHGSRVGAANEAFESLVSAFAARRPDLRVAHGYVELAKPALATAIEEHLAVDSTQLVLVPIFLFAGRHVKTDLPLALARAKQQYPNVRSCSAMPIGAHPLIAELLAERARAALGLASDDGVDDDTCVLVVGRGASDPGANAEFCRLTRLVGENLRAAMCQPAFVGITGPRLPDALALAARLRPRRIVVVPHLLFSGRLITGIERDIASFVDGQPWLRVIRANTLGPAPHVLDVLDARLADALSGAAPLPCNTCAYRAPASDVLAVDGLRALLWSVRHTATHVDTGPHEHAHAAMSRHVLVCGNIDCASRGSIALISAVRARLRRAGHARDVRVTRTSCLGRCGEGPAVAVYPDGVWYRGVTAKDAPELVDQHLLGDALVARLVDTIMQ